MELFHHRRAWGNHPYTDHATLSGVRLVVRGEAGLNVLMEAL